MQKGIVGIDEAGRGPLAGPVSVGAVYIPSGTKLNFQGLKDSKKLSECEREIWYAKMKQWCKEGNIRFSVSLVSNTVIDTKGIVYAINEAMRRSLKKLNIDPKEVSVFLDGSLHAPQEFKKQKTVIKGDEKIKIISLASIAAKVTRDRYMVRLAAQYSRYGFETHKGYGTLRHRNLIKRYGQTKVHRKTFLKNL